MNEHTASLTDLHMVVAVGVGRHGTGDVALGRHSERLDVVELEHGPRPSRVVGQCVAHLAASFVRPVQQVQRLAELKRRQGKPVLDVGR